MLSKAYTLFRVIALILLIGAVGCISKDDQSDSIAAIIVPEVHSDTVRIVVGGDFMQHIPQITAARTKHSTYDYSESLQYVAPMFRDADVAIINFETTITRSRAYSGYPTFKSPIELADALVYIGVDIALLANNHCLDGGAVGLTTTIEEFNRRNIAHTGAFSSLDDYAQNKILYFERNGIRFALFNYTYGVNSFRPVRPQRVNFTNREAILRDISTINRDSVDCLIACMHWGTEYQRVPNTEQLTLSKMLRDAGVNIIIGSHPHVVQRYEVDSTGVVFYSLGNFVSNQRKRYTNGGLVAQIEVVRCDTIRGLQYRVNAHPVYVHMPGYRILPRSVGDTLQMTQDSRYSYQRFMSDTESLIYDRR